jgi:Skp family chaperone for outer membrane proteins
MSLLAVLILAVAGSAHAQAAKIAVLDMSAISRQYKAWLDTENFAESLKDYLFLSSSGFAEVVDLLKQGDALPADKKKRLEELTNLADANDKQFLALRSNAARTAQQDDAYKAMEDLGNNNTAHAQDVLNAAQDDLMKNVQQAAKDIAAQDGYDLVLSAAVVLVGGVDITDKILAKLNGGTAPAPAPTPAPTPAPAPPATGGAH